jgi:hypothetical protein
MPIRTSRRLGGHAKDLPDPTKYAPSNDYHVDDFRTEDTEYARQFDPSLARDHTKFTEAAHETERAGIERVESNVETQVVTHDPDAPAHMHHTLALNFDG